MWVFSACVKDPTTAVPNAFLVGRKPPTITPAYCREDVTRSFLSEFDGYGPGKRHFQFCFRSFDASRRNRTRGVELALTGHGNQKAPPERLSHDVPQLQLFHRFCKFLDLFAFTFNRHLNDLSILPYSRYDTFKATNTRIHMYFFHNF